MENPCKTVRNGGLALDDLLNMAAKDLPEGWQIRIMVEKGCAEVELKDPHSYYHGMCYDDSIEEQFTQAIEYAKKQN